MHRFGFVAAVATLGIALLAGLAVRFGDAAPPPLQGAAVTGRVRFTGAKPTNPLLPAMDDAVCKAKYTTPPREETVIVNPNGTLANVFVYVKAGLPAGASYPAPASPVLIDQDGCRYHPHVFGIQVGQILKIKNSDGIPHNIKAIAKNNQRFNVSEPTTMTMDAPRPFRAPEIMVTLECNFHGWMKAYLGVVAHPFYAVTGSDGSFSIKGLPPGTYTIEAWHEKYGTQTATVTVAATGTKTADFTFAAR